MKRRIITMALALALTLPVYFVLANNATINDWFLYGRGWVTFQPLFDLCNAIGIYGNATILITTMFVISFVIALAGVVLVKAAIRKLHDEAG